MKKILLFLLILFFPFALWAKPIKVVLLNPGGTHWFWQMSIDFMKASAEDLNMELEVITSDWNHYLTIQQMKEIAKRKNPPDYIITGNEKSIAGKIIEIADRAGIDIFLFSNGFVRQSDHDTYGEPREKYKHWIGQMIPDNFSVGYQIGKILIQEALLKNLTAPDGLVHIAAISGAYGTHSSIERVRGLHQIVDEYKNHVKLLQVISANWDGKSAEEITERLFKRYGEINVIWGANDTMAMGAINAVTLFGKTPGTEVLVGGCGWYPPAIEKVSEGVLTTTVGGHFMDAGWVMVLLHDYHHGHDFIADGIQSTMQSIDQSNVQRYKDIFGTPDWRKIDFKKFSKVYTPSLKKYDFRLEKILDQFEPTAPSPTGSPTTSDEQRPSR